ncbi:hypothetical protein ACFU93_33835 [Streptomyces sp. NPDC057611]|uniref:hypothetical protein n=1 Tax=Streptomyces sp. NPDC057611 TaxID=3346182 RepID=UPI0036765329
MSIRSGPTRFKGGVIALTRRLAAEGAPYGIRAETDGAAWACTVPLGTDVGTLDQAYVPPTVQRAGLRRRTVGERAAA